MPHAEKMNIPSPGELRKGKMHVGGKEFKPAWVEAEKWEEGCRVPQSTHLLPLGDSEADRGSRRVGRTGWDERDRKHAGYLRRRGEVKPTSQQAKWGTPVTVLLSPQREDAPHMHSFLTLLFSTQSILQLPRKSNVNGTFSLSPGH